MHDVIVIGGGAGGYAAAIRAAQLGANTALAESAALGGICVNRGCIPTKVWLKAAETLRRIRQAEAFGIRARLEAVDHQAIIARKNACCDKIRQGMEGLLANNGVELLRGHAAFKNPAEIEVDGVRHAARHFVIATGARLEAPPIDGLQDALLTTDDVLDLKKPPSSVLIYGAGTVEVEMASLLAALGSRVHLAGRERRLLPAEDHDSSQRLAQALTEDGIEVIMRSELEAVVISGGKYACRLAGRKARELEVDKVLAFSRRPNSADLGLAQCGVETDEGGWIRVNDFLQTTCATIYAIGDVTGGTLQSHAASAMAIRAVENALGTPAPFAAGLIPRGTWSFPEVASVGLTEEQAEMADLEIEVGYFPYAINGYAIARGEPAGAVKIIKDAQYGTIYGVHIVGAQATELIGEAVLAMQLEYTAEELAAGIRIHPTFSETLVDAARDAEKWALYLPKK